MGNPAANETLMGTYTMVPMPDGTSVLMHKLKNGKWVSTEDRIEAEKKEVEQKEFMDRFADTERKPQTDIRSCEATVEPNLDKIMARHKHTTDHLDAHLGEILGNPDDIIAGKIKIKEVKDPSIRRNVQMMIKALNNPLWNRVAKEHLTLW